MMLVGNDGLSTTPPNGTVFEVKHNLTIRGDKQVVWDMGHEEGIFKLYPDVHLSLCGITLGTGLKEVSRSNFLVPSAISRAEGIRLELEDVKYVTSESVLKECIAFARNVLPSQAFEVQEVRSGCRKTLLVEDWSSETVVASNVVVGCWEFPLLGDENRLQVMHSKQLQAALEKWDKLVGIDEMDIVNDIVFDPLDWPEDGIVLKRNVTLKGDATSPPLVDFRLMSEAIVVRPSTTVVLENMELINLALEDMAPQYASFMWFFKFDRLDNTDPDYHAGVVVRDSTLVVSCEELEHYQYTVALIMDPLQSILQDFSNVTQDIAQWNFVNGPDSTVRVDNGSEYGVAFSNVTFTCKPSHGELLESKTKLASPLRPINVREEEPTTSATTSNETDQDDRPTRRRANVGNEDSSGSGGRAADSNDEDKVETASNDLPAEDLSGDDNNVKTSGSGPETSTMFKVLLGLLVPMFLMLGIAFFWKLVRSKKEATDEEKGPPSKILEDFVNKTKKDPLELSTKDSGSHLRTESVKSPKSPVPLKSPKGSVKASQDPPSSMTEDNDGKSQQGTDVNLPRLNMAGSHCADFIPDILAVSEDIDDKQLVLHELLGKGVHGTVHKGVWRELDVAVKTIVFHGHGESNQDWQQSAIREVAITSGLAHPNLVCTYSYDIKRLHTGSIEGKLVDDPEQQGLRIWDTCVDWKLYIIQEYCDGGSLQQALGMRAFVEKRYGGPGPDLESVLELASGIARGLHHIHSKNIIHGDLKPSNVLLKKVQETHAKVMAKIADFGLSLKMQGSQTHVSNVQHGTTGYMAPEVEEEGSTSKAADVYAFGVVLWEIFMSQLSPTGVTTPEMRQQFPRLPWSCPALYGSLIVACTRLDPSVRPICGEILELLCHAWQQLRMGTLMPPTASPLLRLQQKAREIAVTCRCVDQTAGQRFPDIGGHEEMMERRRNYYAKSLASVPQLFRNVEYDEVYWPESTLE